MCRKMLPVRMKCVFGNKTVAMEYSTGNTRIFVTGGAAPLGLQWKGRG